MITLYSAFDLRANMENTKEYYMLSENQSISDIPTDIQNLAIQHYGNELDQVHFSPLFSELKSLFIGTKCFQKIREFVLDGLESLESVKIGVECFRVDEDYSNNGICRITNCPNLRQLEIASRSFEYFKSFELSNVNSLQSVRFGGDCFSFTDLSLKGGHFGRQW